MIPGFFGYTMFCQKSLSGGVKTATTDDNHMSYPMKCAGSGFYNGKIKNFDDTKRVFLSKALK
jgi:hypothetical protein